jgi:hypothetical protein
MINNMYSSYVDINNKLFDNSLSIKLQFALCLVIGNKRISKNIADYCPDSTLCWLVSKVVVQIFIKNNMLFRKHSCLFSPEQPIAMFSFNHCVISRLGN